MGRCAFGRGATRLPTEKEVYAEHAAEYEALISHEDYDGNILNALRAITPLDGLNVLDAGAGTGRLACLLQPYVKRVIAADLSLHMLGIARAKFLAESSANWGGVAADHRFLPLAARSFDLLVSGWSVSYVTVWYPDDWREQADAWLAEARRVLRSGGHVVLFESLGTGNETPVRLPHLLNFYGWLDEKGFQNNWIRTDYRFDSPEMAAEVAGFFFGVEMKERILREQMNILPECTGIWWLRG